MTAIGLRLEQLSDDVSWFACATELRLHLVLVEDDAREAALRLTLRGARIHERPVPYLLFVEPFAGEEAGWTERLQALEVSYTTVRDELQKRGATIAEPPATREVHSPYVSFGARLAQWVAATAPAADGAVAILAPDQLETPERFREELTALVTADRLSAVRWVVVLPDAGPAAPLMAQLGAAALTSDCVVPPAESAAEIELMMTNASAAGPGAAPHALAGMAWPAQPPPPRRIAGRPVPAPEVDPKDTARLAIRTSLLQAAVATRAGKGLDAVRALRDAYDASVAAELVDERCAIHLMLAGTVAGLGEGKRAIAELERAVAEALALDRPMAAAQAAQAKAALQAVAKDMPAAVASYAEAVAAAKKAGEAAKLMLIDMLRASGQICIEARMEQQGVACWREAIALAEEQPPGEAGTAVDAARALAQLCRKRGLIDHAVSLEAQADRLAAPPTPGAEAN